MHTVKSPFFGCRLLLLLVFVLHPVLSSAQSTLYQQYIEKYKDIAIREMQRYGIPASITLAQGLLESGAGTSLLAEKANNHFGIKTGGNWDGPYFVKDDDATNERFRSYKSVLESYEDHSLFLKNRKRYASLFQLSPTDYRGWAHGLKAAGYATNPEYAQKLISLIEIYNLHEYDLPKTVVALVADKKHHASSKNTNSNPTAKVAESRPALEISVCNGVQYVKARAHDTFATLSQETGISEKHLKKYNDAGEYYTLSPGEPVFLEKKPAHVSKSLRGRAHRVLEGESLHSISQMYAVKLKSLQKANYLGHEFTLSPGDLIILP